MKPLLFVLFLVAQPLLAQAEEPTASPWLSTTPAHIATHEEVRTTILKGIMVNPNAADLRVRVKNGMVTLTGTVGNEEAKKTAEESRARPRERGKSTTVFGSEAESTSWAGCFS